MSTKFQVGDKVRATQSSGTIYAKGDFGQVIQTDTDGTVRVEWDNYGHPWWTREGDVVRHAEAATPRLTLPVVVGKKYVRRDGKVITAEQSGSLICVAADDEPNKMAFSLTAFPKNGSIENNQEESPADLVADYIEPAKGHPHAALMMEFARDAQESATPWDRWEMKWRAGWVPLEMNYLWRAEMEFRRKPTVTPDPHAESAAEYAKDMAETDKAWQLWEQRYIGGDDYSGPWHVLLEHPRWSMTRQYRRRPV